MSDPQGFQLHSSHRIFVAGHNGMVGSAIVRSLKKSNYVNLILRDKEELDLSRQKEVEEFFSKENIDVVFIAAAKVGGIQANKDFIGDFLFENLMIQNNLIHASMNSKVKKVLFLGSSCIYPKMAPQPLKEEYLLTGPLEPTNEGYAIAKIAGLKLCQFYYRQHNMNFISAMPTNLYGPGDSYHPLYSHVVPALLRRFHMAKMNNLDSVEIWGSGTPLREFLYVEDLAEALVLLMEKYSAEETINVGTGKEVSIADLAQLIKAIVGYEGQITFDKNKPDGTPRKVLDLSKISKLGWTAGTPLPEGLQKTYAHVLENEIFKE